LPGSLGPPVRTPHPVNPYAADARSSPCYGKSSVWGESRDPHRVKALPRTPPSFPPRNPSRPPPSAGFTRIGRPLFAAYMFAERRIGMALRSRFFRNWSGRWPARLAIRIPPVTGACGYHVLAVSDPVIGLYPHARSRRRPMGRPTAPLAAVVRRNSGIVPPDALFDREGRATRPTPCHLSRAQTVRARGITIRPRGSPKPGPPSLGPISRRLVNRATLSRRDLFP